MSSYQIYLTRLQFWLQNTFNKTPVNVCVRSIWLNVLYQLYQESHLNIINSDVSFSDSRTRSTGLKLKYNTTLLTNNVTFILIVYIDYGTLYIPIINMDLSTFTIKNQLKQFFRNHFITNFISTNTHKLHYLCPCGSCINNSLTNFEHL